MITNNSKYSKIEIEEFEAIFKNYYKPLCILAYGIVKDMDNAEEIVQDLFFYYWNNQRSLNIKSSTKAYLYKSVYNRSLKHIRADGVRQKYAEYMKSQSISTDNTTIELIEAKEINKIIERTLNELPQKDTRIFRMNRFEGLKYREIADILSISIKTVEAAMGKTLAALRKKLSNYNYIKT